MVHARTPSKAHRSRDLLTLLLSATDADGRPLDDNEIRDHLMTFLLVGHETTGNALTWTWLLLSRFKPVRTQLDREVETVLLGSLPALDDFPRLRHTKMMSEESLRLFLQPGSCTPASAVPETSCPSGGSASPMRQDVYQPLEHAPEPTMVSRPGPIRSGAFLGRRGAPEAGFLLHSGRKMCSPLARRIVCRDGRYPDRDDIGVESLLPIARRTNDPPDPLMTLRPHMPVQMSVELVMSMVSPSTST